MKNLLICLLFVTLMTACKDDNIETSLIPEYEKFALKPGAQLIFLNEQGVNDTFVVNCLNIYTESSLYNNDFGEKERVDFNKPNSMLPFSYVIEKYGKPEWAKRNCGIYIYFYNDTIYNYQYKLEYSIIINYKLNENTYPYVYYIVRNKNNTNWRLFFSPQYGIIKYQLQDSIVWSLNKIIE